MLFPHELYQATGVLGMGLVDLAYKLLISAGALSSVSSLLFRAGIIIGTVSAIGVIASIVALSIIAAVLTMVITLSASLLPELVFGVVLASGLGFI